MSKNKASDIPPFVTCELCNDSFSDEETQEAHQRTELGRLQPSNRFLSMPKLPKCYSKEARWAMGWRSKKYGKTLHIWTRPPMPKPRAHRISEDAYVCLFCAKAFACATGFKSHFILTFTSKERCLDAHELGALAFERNASGVFRLTPMSQYLPSQIARLPTVRAEMESLEAYEKTTRELRDAAEAPINLRLDLNDNPPGVSYVHFEEVPPAKATLPEPSVAKAMLAAFAADLIAAASDAS